LRIGYLMSAAQTHVTPALKELRRDFPKTKVTLLDLAPGAQIAALRAGTIDLALIGHEGGLIAKEFHTRTIASFRVVAALSADHRLAKKRAVGLKELAGEPFVGFPEEDMPGRNGWMKTICRPAGFQPSFLWLADSLTHTLSLVVSEQAVTLLPSYLTKFPHPGVVLLRLHDSTAMWEFIVARPRGKAGNAALRFIAALDRS
jgi:DNA-binding transcriptional LysR family regulator